MASKLDVIKDWDPRLEEARFRIDELIRKLPIPTSARNLRRHFLEVFGKSPKELCEDRRLAKAPGLVLDGQDEKTMADLLGFASIQQFSTWFKKNFGLCPRKFFENHMTGLQPRSPPPRRWRSSSILLR